MDMQDFTNKELAKRLEVLGYMQVADMTDEQVDELVSIRKTVKNREHAQALGAARVLAEQSTQKARWDRAVKAIRKDDTKIKQNVMGCCRGCIASAAFGLTEKEAETACVAWTFGGQGQATRFEGDVMEYRTQSRYEGNLSVTNVYFNHSNGAAPKIVAAFEAEGFDVVWDGNDTSCVVVNVNA